MNMDTDKIIALANEAARSALDAFSTDELPPAEAAYEFIRQLRWEEYPGTDTEAQTVWDSLELSVSDWVIFRAAYKAALAQVEAIR